MFLAVPLFRHYARRAAGGAGKAYLQIRVRSARDQALADKLDAVTGDNNVVNLLDKQLPLDAAWPGLTFEKVDSERAGCVPGRERLEMIGVRTATYPAQSIDLAVKRGEILGLAGLVGSGRTELARAIFGVDRPLAARSASTASRSPSRSPRDAIARGIYLVPEDRKRSGPAARLLGRRQHLAARSRRPMRGRLMVDAARETANAERQRERLNIQTPSVATTVGSLSGGNQQKVVLAKWLSMQPRVLIFDEPTRGIDVGAKNEIYQLMRALADSGVAILMISSDMEEVIGVSDRIAVMHEGAHQRLPRPRARSASRTSCSSPSAIGQG